MSQSPLLGADELGFVSLVSARRFGGEPASAEQLAAVVGRISGSTAFARAAALAQSLLGSGAVAAAGPAALLAMCCQLRRDGLELVAPQGAVAGMIAGLGAGRFDVATVAGWLEDRCVAAAGAT